MSSVPETTSTARLRTSAFPRFAFLPLFAFALAGLVSAAEPVPPPALRSLGEGGAEILQQLRSLGTTGTVLHVGAHPDDENTELITWLSLGRGYRAAYLSLTRGDGGQNELGKDFDEKLGVLRTQELLAARRLDHGRQFFTRAIDFGYSKTPGETLHFWDRDAVLGDVVRVIRQFRPDVIVTRFPVPPGSGGHGHHTASAILAVEAFKLAGDPAAYPEQLAQGLTVWQPKRVLWNSFRFGSAGPGPLNGPTIKQDIGGTDPVSGQEFGTIAARSRAMHQTQGLAGAVNRARTGVNEQSFMLLAGDLPGGWPGQTPAGQQAGTAQPDLMDGVDTTWARYPGGAEIQQLVDAAIAGFKADDPAASVPALLQIRAKLEALGGRPPSYINRVNAAAPPGYVEPVARRIHREFLSERIVQLDRVIVAALGLRVQAVSQNSTVVPGEKIQVRLLAAVDAASPAVGLASAGMMDSESIDIAEKSSPMQPHSPVLSTVETVVAGDTPLTHPYWLRDDPVGGLATVRDNWLIGLPENRPTLTAGFTFKIENTVFEITDVPVTVQGGQPVAVVSPVSLALASDIFVLAPGASKPVEVEVSATRANTGGKLSLELPAGWKAAPVSQEFNLTRAGDKAILTFTLTAPSSASAGRLTAVAEIGGKKWPHQRIELNYPHLPPQLLQPPARARLIAADIDIKAKTIGYLPGAGDSVAECLEQMGCVVHRLTGADLTPEKLQGLDAVVIGVRAFNERTDLKDAFPGLLAWVEAGGTVIAQYNRPDGLKTPQLGPFPLSIEGPAPDLRVTDETAPVTLLAPDDAALNTPNRIAAEDFNGWVQERGAYFPSKWDERYTPLLAMGDPGEAPLKSSILVARHGRGHYVYTGIGFFRQLPAGVPGAYRLFANLLSLGK